MLRTAAYNLFSLSRAARSCCGGQLSLALREFSAAPEDDTSKIGNEKVQKLAADVMGLTVLEASWLSEILRKKLKIERPAMGAAMMPMMAMPAGAPGAAAAGGAPAAAAGAAAKKDEKSEEKKEKMTFDIKLDSFSADGKIKVIKEIRAITSLGLKEAKELVEKAPVVVKQQVSKADAEAMKKALEAAGAKVVME